MYVKVLLATFMCWKSCLFCSSLLTCILFYLFYYYDIASVVNAVLEVGDGVFEVLSTSGDTHLGGDDFDKVNQHLMKDSV